MGLFYGDTTREACFSPCRTWRYWLKRTWLEQAPAAAFLLLNPSAANEKKDDPTATRVIRRVKALRGYGSIYIINVFAYITPFPSTIVRMFGAIDVVGPDNNAHIINVLAKCSMVICGWGAFPLLPDRFAEVKEILRFAAKDKTYHLGMTTGGHPKHPLYIPYFVQPIRWKI